MSVEPFSVDKILEEASQHDSLFIHESSQSLHTFFHSFTTTSPNHDQSYILSSKRPLSTFKSTLISPTCPEISIPPTLNIPQDLLNALSRQVFAKKSTIITQNTPGACLFILLVGTVSIIQSDPDSIPSAETVSTLITQHVSPNYPSLHLYNPHADVEPLATLTAGSVFGELALFYDTVRSASVIAVEKCIVAKVTQAEWQSWERDTRMLEWCKNVRDTAKARWKQIGGEMTAVVETDSTCRASTSLQLDRKSPRNSLSIPSSSRLRRGSLDRPRRSSLSSTFSRSPSLTASESVTQSVHVFLEDHPVLKALSDDERFLLANYYARTLVVKEEVMVENVICAIVIGGRVNGKSEGDGWDEYQSVITFVPSPSETLEVDLPVVCLFAVEDFTRFLLENPAAQRHVTFPLPWRSHPLTDGSSPTTANSAPSTTPQILTTSARAKLVHESIDPTQETPIFSHDISAPSDDDIGMNEEGSDTDSDAPSFGSPEQSPHASFQDVAGGKRTPLSLITNQSRRRLSIAVWADPNLAAVADRATERANDRKKVLSPPPSPGYAVRKDFDPAGVGREGVIEKKTCLTPTHSTGEDQLRTPSTLSTPTSATGAGLLLAKGVPCASPASSVKVSDGPVAINIILDQSRVLDQIFHELDLQSLVALSRTCQSWRIAVTNWRANIDFEPYKGAVTDDLFRSFFSPSTTARHTRQSTQTSLSLYKNLSTHYRNPSNLQHLKVTNCWHLTDDGVRDVIGRLGRVRELSLFGIWKITDLAFGAILPAVEGLLPAPVPAPAIKPAFPELTVLDLSNLRKLTNQSLDAILNHSPSLQSLQLSYCKSIDDDLLKSNPPRWKHLKMLGLKRCTGIRGPGFNHWREWVEQSDGKDDENMNTTHHDNVSPTESTNGQVPSFQMGILDLSDLPHLPPTILPLISRTLTALTSLTLSFCLSLSSFHLLALPHLITLDLQATVITDDELRVLPSRCPLLQNISIRMCPNVTLAGVETLTRGENIAWINAGGCNKVRIERAEMMLGGGLEERQVQGDEGETRRVMIMWP